MAGGGGGWRGVAGGGGGWRGGGLGLHGWGAEVNPHGKESSEGFFLLCPMAHGAALSDLATRVKRALSGQFRWGSMNPAVTFAPRNPNEPGQQANPPNQCYKSQRLGKDTLIP